MKKLYSFFLSIVLIVFIILFYFIFSKKNYSDKDIIEISSIVQHSSDNNTIFLLEKKYSLYKDINYNHYLLTIQKKYNNLDIWKNFVKNSTQFFIQHIFKSRKRVISYYQDSAYIKKKKRFKENLMIFEFQVKENDHKHENTLDLPQNYFKVYTSNIEVFYLNLTIQEAQYQNIINIYEYYKYQKLTYRNVFNDKKVLILKEIFNQGKLKEKMYYYNGFFLFKEII